MDINSNSGAVLRGQNIVITLKSAFYKTLISLVTVQPFQPIIELKKKKGDVFIFNPPEH